MGRDTLQGGGNDDILIGGQSKIDPHSEAMATIVDEWELVSRNYATRVTHLKNGGGANGTTVFSDLAMPDDRARDTLTGGVGNDWYWTNLPLDLIPDKQKAEKVK